MARYLDPKNDLIFKRIFGEHPRLLISFLNSLMPFEEGRFIEEVQYLSAEQVPENPGKKNSIVDVKCKDNYDRHFIVEMQMYWSTSFNNRMVFNAGKAYVRQLNKNEEYHLLQPVYTLAILNENFDHKTEQFYHHYQIVNKENTDEVISGFEFVLIELPKFRPQNWENRKLAALWLRFLSEVDEKLRYLPKEMQENEEINQAAELCEEAAFTDGELLAYDDYWDAVRIEKTKQRDMQDLKDAVEKLKDDVKKSRAEGEAKGRAEKAKQIVLNSHRNGIPVETIAIIADLTVEQVKEILTN